MIAIAKKSARKFPRGWKQRFEEMLPVLYLRARFAFRYLPPSERDEAVSDVVANAFCAFRRLAELGKIDVAYAGALTRFAIAQYRSGRRVGTSLCKGDVLASPERFHGRRVVASLSYSVDDRDWCETIADDRHWSIPEQAAFRVDFPTWLRSLTRRDRRLVKFLGVGNRTCDAAEKFGLTAGRISQLRTEWKSAWEAFHALPGDEGNVSFQPA
jgi:hypothetical protein